MSQHLRGPTSCQVVIICCGHIWPLEGDVFSKWICQIYQKCRHFFVFTPKIFTIYPKALIQGSKHPLVLLYTNIPCRTPYPLHVGHGWSTARQWKCTPKVPVEYFQIWIDSGCGDTVDAYVILDLSANEYYAISIMSTFTTTFSNQYYMILLVKIGAIFRILFLSFRVLLKVIATNKSDLIMVLLISNWVRFARVMDKMKIHLYVGWKRCFAYISFKWRSID